MEQVLTIVFISLAIVIILVGQISVIWTVVKTDHLQTPHFWIVLVYCFTDIILNLIASPNIIIQFTIDNLNSMYIRTCSAIALSTALGQALNVGLLAFERYVFFCKPLLYGQIFTVQKLTITVACMYILPTVYVVMTEIFIGREYHPSILSTNLPKSALHSTLQLCLILLPSGEFYCQHVIL